MHNWGWKLKMTPKEKRIFEAVIGLAFILVLLVVVLLVTGTGHTTKIKNSYNTYTIQQAPEVYGKPYIVDKGDYARIYYVEKDYKYADYTSNKLRYDSWAHHDIISGIFGATTDRYEVNVENRENVGGYFTVKFYLEKYSGRTDVRTITYYISSNDEKKFVFKDIVPKEDRYVSWHYEVISKTRSSARVYYNN